MRDRGGHQQARDVAVAKSADVSMANHEKKFIASPCLWLRCLCANFYFFVAVVRYAAFVNLQVKRVRCARQWTNRNPLGKSGALIMAMSCIKYAAAHKQWCGVPRRFGLGGALVLEFGFVYVAPSPQPSPVNGRGSRGSGARLIRRWMMPKYWSLATAHLQLLT